MSSIEDIIAKAKGETEEKDGCAEFLIALILMLPLGIAGMAWNAYVLHKCCIWYSWLFEMKPLTFAQIVAVLLVVCAVKTSLSRWNKVDKTQRVLGTMIGASISAFLMWGSLLAAAWWFAPERPAPAPTAVEQPAK